VTEHVVAPVVSEVVAPLAELPQAVAVEAARSLNWTLIVCVLLLMGSGGAVALYVSYTGTLPRMSVLVPMVQAWWKSIR